MGGSVVSSFGDVVCVILIFKVKLREGVVVSVVLVFEVIVIKSGWCVRFGKFEGEVRIVGGRLEDGGGVGMYWGVGFFFFVVVEGSVVGGE